MISAELSGSMESKLSLSVIHVIPGASWSQQIVGGREVHCKQSYRETYHWMKGIDYLHFPQIYLDIYLISSKQFVFGIISLQLPDTV